MQAPDRDLSKSVIIRLYGGGTMTEKPEVCVRCDGTDVVPRGKEMYKGRKVDTAECKRCGIIFVLCKFRSKTSK